LQNEIDALEMKDVMFFSAEEKALLNKKKAYEVELIKKCDKYSIKKYKSRRKALDECLNSDEDDDVKEEGVISTTQAKK